MIGVEPLVKIQFLDGQGLSKTQIARRLGVDRKTVRKCLARNVKDFDKHRTQSSEVWQSTPVTDEQKKVFATLQVEPPPRYLSVAVAKGAGA